MATKKFDSIVVFGDGLNDMGHWGKLTNYQYPPAAHGFYESRWTNGKVWVEHFADSLGLKLTLENNYSMGGATTGLYNINEPLKSALKLDEKTPLLGMLEQVQTYLSTNPKIDEKTIFVLWAGGHDIGNYLEYGQPDLEQYPPANNYKHAIDLLVKAGAKNIFVGTMPDMGYSPGYVGTDKQAKASELCQNLNRGLQEIEDSYKSTAVKFYKFDGASVFADIGMNPAQYGIKYTEAYLPMNIINFMNPLEKANIAIPNKDKGLNPDEFMNWWAVSASAKVHKVIAGEAVKFIHSTN
ncbi:MAG: SGNH/GDSL hydrolase family protein [Acholeplasmataceae bacterium]|nr:SGNH/GDSL hydrolase family protein [Acholeplasmataceae bacterium]